MNVAVQWTVCPDESCGHIAEIEWRDALSGTSGHVEMAKVRCVQRHWFLLPVDHLARAAL